MRPATALATNVHFAADMVHVSLADGRQVSAPLEWFPRLRAATKEQRVHWRLIGGGIGIHWKDLHEDLYSVGLLAH